MRTPLSTLRPTTLVLGALLLAPSVQARQAAPAPTPAPLEAPAVGVPAAPDTAPQVLTLGASVGAGVTLTSTSTLHLRLSDVQVRALPGSSTPPARVEEIRRALSAGAAQAGSTATQTGKVFHRVTTRDAAGVTLLSTAVQSGPGRPTTALRITQTVGPGGQLGGVKITSDDPALNAVLGGQTMDELTQAATAQGAGLGVYGRPLVVGETWISAVTVPTQALLTRVFAALAGPVNAARLDRQVRAGPLTMTTSTVYQGLNAQGLHAFSTAGTARPWSVDIGPQGDLPGLRLELVKLDTHGTQTYRRDGLPAGSVQTTQQQMRVTMQLEGVQVQLGMSIEQSTILQPG